MPSHKTQKTILILTLASAVLAALVLCLRFRGAGSRGTEAGVLTTAEETAAETTAEGQTVAQENETGDKDAEAGASVAPKASEETAAEDSVAPRETEVERLLEQMTSRERVAQLFFVTPEALTGVDAATRTGEQTKEAFDRNPVGGVVYFAKNLLSETQTQEMLSTLQEYAMERQRIPLFLGVDEEGGRVLRVGGREGFSAGRTEAAGELAAGGAEAVRDAGETIGAYLRTLGFNLDFAPVADVLTEPANQVIGDRSFGNDPQEVAALAWDFAEGLRAQGVVPCYKHFPGHGGTKEDTHEGYAYSHKTLEELREAELVPFADGSARGTEMVMAAHISLPEITGSDVPASLSREIITGILRKELGYQGVVITDALDMGAVSEHYAPGEAAVLALQAGCDMLLLTSDFSASRQAVLDALEDGTLTQERIDESVRRILAVKTTLTGGM